MKSIVNPIEYAKKAAEEYQSIYGSKLVSVILYGSAAGSDFNPEKSDINLLVVLASMDIGLIAHSADIQKKQMKQRFSKPLFMDKKYIVSSCDSYPMEFLDMKQQYTVLIGEDVLNTIAPKMNDLRLQVERELKGKWLHLIDEYTFAFKNRRQLVSLIELSLRAFAPVFRALLKLKGITVPSGGRKSLLSAIESAFSIEGQPLQHILEASFSSTITELRNHFIKYSQAVKIVIDTTETI